MKLEDYVKETLLAITNGVVSAQNESMVWIAPGFVDGEKQSKHYNVSFEVGVSIAKEGSGGLNVFSVGEAKANVSAETVNKVSFEVPVYFQAPTPMNPKHFSNNEDSE